MSCGCEGARHLRHDDVVIPQGTNHVLVWPVLELDGDPIDWTGWTAVAQARASIGGELRQSWTTADNSIVLADDGTLTMYFTPEMTDAWPWPRAEYGVELTDPDGNVYRLTQGTMTNDKSVVV